VAAKGITKRYLFIAFLLLAIKVPFASIYYRRNFHHHFYYFNILFLECNYSNFYCLLVCCWLAGWLDGCCCLDAAEGIKINAFHNLKLKFMSAVNVCVRYTHRNYIHYCMMSFPCHKQTRSLPFSVSVYDVKLP